MPIRSGRSALIAFSLPLILVSIAAQATPESASISCPRCEQWNAPQAPFRIYGNSYYVGTRGLSSVLVTSEAGHVLIDGGLPQSAPLIAANVAKLGFDVRDIELIVGSHTHYDHAGGIAELQRLSGARVASSPAGAAALERGLPGRDDPQADFRGGFPAVPNVQVLTDRQTVHVGPLALTVNFTPGHTPGGTSWSWQSCEAHRCLNLVYGDSLTPVSADSFRFSDNETYPNVVQDFHRSFAVFERLGCDILVTAHPEATGLWARLERRDAGDADALIEPEPCRAYAAAARLRFQARLKTEAEQAAN